MPDPAQQATSAVIAEGSPTSGRVRRYILQAG